MPTAIRFIDTIQNNAQQFLAELRAQLTPDGNIVSTAGQSLTQKVFGEALSPLQSVQRICHCVQSERFPALVRFSKAFDHFDLTPANFRVTQQELQAAHHSIGSEFLTAIRRIKENILRFQQAILHKDVAISPNPGQQLGLRYRPVHRIGICVPGGAAAYPSSVLMTVVPALAAAVKEIAIVSPPTPNGSNNQAIQATCHELGISELIRLGGAQGVAALAYGIDGLLKPVDMIVGPGNLFVALAKRHVFGQVGIDNIAGPSEVIVLADDSANPAWVAADLIAQAEHSPGASLLITWSKPLADAVKLQLDVQLQTLSRGDLAKDCLEKFGAIILCSSQQEAVELTNQIAPEHLHVQTKDAHQLSQQLHNAGAIFQGHYTPVALGDYAAGPSHVLPTGGTARFASGLSANDFLKRTSLISYDAANLADIAATVTLIANSEGLTGHAHSVNVRKEAPSL